MIQLVSWTPKHKQRMIRIDTYKIKIPGDNIFEIKEKALLHSKEEKEGRICRNDYILKSAYLGLKSIKYDKLRDEVIVEGSAKILKDQYYDLINIETVERLFKEINLNKLITFDLARAIDNSELLKVDTTQNLSITDKSKEYVNSLNHLRVDPKYRVEQYARKDNLGISFTGKQRSFKERQIYYDKLLDIQKDKELIKAVKYSSLEKQFKDTLRVESNFTQLRKIRSLCGGSNSLIEVLKSNSKPNFDIFEKISSNYNPLSLFDDYDGYKLSEIEKLEGRKKIIRDLNYDIVLIYKFLESKLLGNISRYKREYKSLLASELGGVNVPKVNKHIAEIKEQLKIA